MLPPFFHQTPFFRLLLPFIAGIVVAFRFAIPAGGCIWVCVLASTGLCILVWKRKRFTLRRSGWLYGIFLNIFFIAAGFLTVMLHSFTPVQESEYGVWLAVVNEPPTERENTMKATVHVRANLAEETQTACDELVVAYFRKDSISRQIRQGDLLMIEATLNPVTNAGNPYEFDYQVYLSRRYISRTVFVESGYWQQLDSYSQGPLLNISNRIRNHLLDVLKRAGLSGNEFSVASALVLGYRAELDEELRQAYSASGAMHILAVSGMHVGIVYLFFSSLLKLLPFIYRSRWLRAIVSLAFLWFFAMLTGMSPSVMRATTMFSFIAAGAALQRSTYTYNSIAASAFVLLLFNPNNLFNVSFQFSYMAVIAIVFINRHLYGLFTFKNRLLNQAWNLTCVSIAAQIGTAPLALFYFHQFPTYFILSNFVVIPAATVIIYGALILFMVSPVPLLLGTFGWLLDKFLYMINFLIFFIEKLPGSVILEIRFASWEIIFAYTLVAALSIWMLTKRKTALFATVLIIMFWMTGTTIRTGNDLRRQQLIVYNTQGNSILQFIDGYKHANWYTIRNPSFNVPGFIKNQRIAMQLKDGQYFSLDSVLLSEKDVSLPLELYKDQNLIQFAGKRLAIFTRDMPPQNAGQLSLNTDVAILSQNVNIRISQIIETYRPGMIVMDSSNSQARTDRWETECIEAGVPYHRVDKEGAFVLTQTFHAE